MVPRFWAPTTDESDSKINLFLSILDPVLVSWKNAILFSLLDTLQFAPVVFEVDAFVIQAAFFVGAIWFKRGDILKMYNMY